MSAVSLMFILLLLIVFKKSLCLTGDNVCQNSSSQYCCAHSEKRGDVCIECEIGFHSKGNDDPCTKCPPGMFGLKCTDQCNCTISRCDHVYGCSGRNMGITTQTSRKDDVTKADINFPDIISTNRNVDRDVIGKSNVPDMDAISPRELLIYGIVGAFVLFVMGVCFMFNTYRFKLQRKHLEIEKIKGDLIDTDSVETSHKSEDTEDLYHYHVIDENKMCDMVSVKKPEIPNMRLKVIRSSSESGSSEDQNEIPNEYLHPYNALLHKSETHEYERATDVHVHDEITESTTSGSNMSLPETDKQGYLHMYQPLEPPKMHSGKQCVVTASVSRADESSSDSDTDQGYSNTYQPLRQEDIRCHVYEKPLMTTLTVFDALSTDLKSKPTAKSSSTLQDERKRNGQLGIDGTPDLNISVGTPSSADRVKTL